MPKSKLKKIFIGALVLIMVIITAPKPIAADVSQTTIDYLKAQSQSAWITMALVAAGESDVATNHLQSVSGNLVTDYATTILALAALNLNPRTFGNVDYVAQIKAKYQNNQLGDSSLLNDDFWGILALAAAGEDINSAEVAGAKNFILAHQNQDGGFSYRVGGDSDTNDTAAAILALVEAGKSTNSTEIVNALNYLTATQNNDGGFSWDGQSESDTDSTAWIVWAIRKVGQDPTTWQQGQNNPLSFIESMANQDGSYSWLASNPSPNLAATIDAVMALAGVTMPIGYYQQIQPNTYHLRIEGQSETICDAYVSATNALDIVENGASVCNYTYLITQEIWGPYLRQINDDAAAGMSGWLGFLNYESFQMSADQYDLSEGDEVLYYYGEWGWLPLRLIVDNQANSGQALTATVQYFDNSSWQPAAEAIIRGGNMDYITNENGQVELLLPDGYYTLYALKANYIRSESKTVQVGDGVFQRVGLQVEVEQTGGIGRIGGEAIIFEVNPDNINFGKLKPGESNSTAVTLSNQGTVNLAVSAAVSGDFIFTDNLQIDSESWRDFSANLNSGDNQESEVSLPIPNDYISSGIKTGELIFWAQVR